MRVAHSRRVAGPARLSDESTLVLSRASPMPCLGIEPGAVSRAAAGSHEQKDSCSCAHRELPSGFCDQAGKSRTESLARLSSASC